LSTLNAYTLAGWLLISCINFTINIPRGFAAETVYEKKNFSAGNQLLDTSITALDPTLSCGTTSSVRLRAGLAGLYQWTRNGIIIPGATARQYTALVSGFYRVRVSDTNGNIDSSRLIEVLIVPIPDVSFSINQSAQCLTGNNFIFTNTSTISEGSANYSWFYGDGAFSISQNGARSYATAGTYSVKLVATSNYGCIDSSIQTVITSIPSRVDFTVSNPSQCINANQFLFVNNSTGNGLLTYRWDFGDGSSSTVPNPGYQYSQWGNYFVKLVTTNQSGCRDSIAKSINIHPKPSVQFTANSNQQCQTGNFFQFTNTSSIQLGALSYRWEFGDGIQSGVVSPSHSFLKDGSYSIKLIATSDKGCTDSTSQLMMVHPSPISLFTVNKTVDCFNDHSFEFTNKGTIPNGSFSSIWDFGDGIGTSTNVNPTYKYLQPGTYRVNLTLRTQNNCTSSYTINLFLNPSPSGVILPIADSVICDGQFFELKATSASFYQWYRDGLPISGATAGTYNATEPGTYSVLFRNTNNCTTFSTNRFTLTKLFSPVPNFDVDRICAGLSTTFLNTSNVANSEPVKYQWNFGDGAKSDLFMPKHTYAASGVYNVRLTVTPTKCTQLERSIQKQITIQASPQGIRYQPQNAVSGKPLQLRARNFSGASYLWSPTTGLNVNNVSDPVFTHSAPQQYLISITNLAGCNFTDTLLVRMFSEKKIFVPDYFTPNGDGNNDKLFPFIVGIKNFNYFKIWNRWGQLVFQTQKEGDGWDGTLRGIKQPMETYLWMAEGLDIDGKIFQARGSFVLVR